MLLLKFWLSLFWLSLKFVPVRDKITNLYAAALIEFCAGAITVQNHNSEVSRSFLYLRAEFSVLCYSRLGVGSFLIIEEGSGRCQVKRRIGHASFTTQARQ